jgi:hypothetical protein
LATWLFSRSSLALYEAPVPTKHLKNVRDVRYRSNHALTEYFNQNTLLRIAKARRSKHSAGKGKN